MLKVTGKKKIFSGNYLKVWSTEFVDKKGGRVNWEWCEGRDAVHIFPITPEQEVVLIRNYRIPLEQYVIEMPAGLLDKNGETMEEAAKRELLEETGYSAEKLTALKRAWPHQSGMSNGISYCFIATGLKKIRDTAGDDSEDIEVIKIPLKNLMDFYLNLPDNMLFNMSILAAADIIKRLKIRG